jgi:hypothetical protein
MRIAFDMDGVVADMDGALAKLAEEMFSRESRGKKSGARPSRADADSTPLSPSPAAADRAADADQATRHPAFETYTVLARLTPRQQTQLWKRVEETSDFWMKLDETESGVVARLWKLARERRWEVIFVTQRPKTNGQTVQIQTQRWLRKHGFDMPSVYTTRGSRGKIAAALSLDALVDDRLENCVDVATESRAWSICIARRVEDLASMEARARRMGIAVVPTVMEALGKLEEADRAEPGVPEEAGLLARLRRAFRPAGR